MYSTTDFKIEELSLAGVLKITQSSFNDHRGSIWSLYTKSLKLYFTELGLDFSHVKFNTNKKNVLRGIHFDSWSTKLVTCVAGEIKQFVVDLNRESPSFGEYECLTLRGGDGVSVLIPQVTVTPLL